MTELNYLNAVCYHAAPGFQHHLEAELSHDFFCTDGELITKLGPQVQAYWVRNIWQKPFTAKFNSISEAVKLLKGIQRNWAPYAHRLARRTTLIAEGLPHIPNKPKEFPFCAPSAPMGAFTLLDEHTLLASAQCTSPWPNGEFAFVEDHEGPPSRAYRKLWEALVVACSYSEQRTPKAFALSRLLKAGDVCIDAGACPGGWTWVLAKLGAKVTAIDRSPLEPRVAAMPGVTFLKHNVFTLKPKDFGLIDWLFSDVICYPKALYEWINLWVESGQVRNFICTIKMQGEEWDKETTEKFAQIPGSKVLHLCHNKHELTWIKIGN